MSQKVESCIICENYRFWLELQLVDDKGQPLANVPYTLAERGTGRTMQGSSDPQGLIKAEGLTARPYTLSLEPQPLADALTTMSPPAVIQGNDKSLSDYCREQRYLLSENNRAGAFNPNAPTTVHRMTAGQINRSTHYQQRDKGYPLLFPYNHRRVIAIKRIAEPVFAKSTLRGLGNTDEGLDVESLANFGVCDYSNYTCNTTSNSTQTVPQSSWVSSFFSALNPIGTAQAFPIGGAMGSGAMASGGVVGGAVGKQDTSFGWDNSQESANHRIARHLEHELRQPSPLVLSANILFAMVANYYEGDSLTQPDLLEIAVMGGSAPTRMRVGFASTGTTAAAMASASQLIAYHTERDSGFDQVPVIKGELASEAEAREVLSLPIYQSPNGLPNANTQAEIYRFDAGGTILYMGVSASGGIINISARIDDIPKGPTIHAGPSPLPQKVEKPEGFAIHESDTRPETLPIADDGIVWRHTGHDVEPVDFRDYILTVDRKDVKPVYVSLNESKNVTNSAGETVERKFVEDQDGLLEEAEKAAGGSLDNFKPIKEHWYESPDGTRRIEWNPDGHKNTNEGPHVTIRDYNGKRYGVTDKVFIKGREKYDGKP
ncbi:S-type pyocin domain-containing protein [Providencia sp. Me31A]|uniref:S-type pyocin domain-containing protein n=1 Tax=Providencia sp. Me31A TaxID=3392637 RepID=UPI003D297B40